MATSLLRTSESEYLKTARLAAIIESSFDAIIAKDVNSIITDWNPAAQRMFGYSAEEAVGQSVLMLIPPHLQGEETIIIDKIRQGLAVASYDTVRVGKDGQAIYVSLTVSPIRDEQGGIVGASKIVRDVTQARQNEHRIRQLLMEVSHRVKNQFAVILSLIREIGARTEDKSKFVERIRERIIALARSHDLLVSGQWIGADLNELVREHLKPFGYEERVTVEGPKIVLTPNAAQYLGMAFHELGTNAAKYGALSDAGGALTVSWYITSEDGQDTVNLEWIEQTAAASGNAEPHKGFGSVVLGRIVPHSVSGKGGINYSDGEIRWWLNAPLSALTPQNRETA